MGMYDTITCAYPLPGRRAPFESTDHEYQTKDLDCYMNHYHIDPDGKLVGEENFYGDVSFYSSNIVGTGPGIYTANGEDAISVEYVATFIDSRISKVVQTEYEVAPALPIASTRGEQKTPSADDIERWKIREAESLVGRTIYVLYGGMDEGYHVEVIAESEKQLCTRLIEDSGHEKAGGFEILDRWSRDITFFDNKEDAEKRKNKRSSEWDKQKRKYNEYAATWVAAEGESEAK